jgi:hypothetical protein
MDGASIIVGFLLLVLYFLPSIAGRHKRNASAIFALNLFLGWTLVGWVVSVVWALTKDPEQPQVSRAIWNCAYCQSPLRRQTDSFCPTCGTPIIWD